MQHLNVEASLFLLEWMNRTSDNFVQFWVPSASNNLVYSPPKAITIICMIWLLEHLSSSLLFFFSWRCLHFSPRRGVSSSRRCARYKHCSFMRLFLVSGSARYLRCSASCGSCSWGIETFIISIIRCLRPAIPILSRTRGLGVGSAFLLRLSRCSLILNRS